MPAVRGVLWQKERLLNIGIERAAPHCKKIVWADLDIDFLSDTWVNDLSAALDDHDVVQPFAWAYRMMSHEEDQARERQAAHQHSQFLRSAGAAAAVAAAASGPALSQVDVLTKMPTGASDGQILHSAGFGLSVLRNMNRSDEGVDARLRGHSGYACAARRDFLSRVGGLYDKMITGGGDDIMAKAWQNMGVVGQAHDKYPAALQRNASAWIAQVGAQTQGMVGFLRGVILHHYHGSQANRHYSMRMRILHDNQFDPATDIKKDPATGVWVWRNDPGKCAWAAQRGRCIAACFHSCSRVAMRTLLSLASIDGMFALSIGLGNESKQSTRTGNAWTKCECLHWSTSSRARKIRPCPQTRGCLAWQSKIGSKCASGSSNSGVCTSTWNLCPRV